MDFSYLVNILFRRKWLLLSVVVLSALATWTFVGNLPDVYNAKAVISTGIIDYKGVTLQKENPFIQKFQIESSFNSMLEKMKSRTILKLLTEKLLLHDLQADGVHEKPFRIPKSKGLGMSQGELDKLVLKLKANLNDSLLNEKPIDISTNNLAQAYEYNYEKLQKKLEIQRIGETDYLRIEFKSENPDLSYYAVNTFIREFFKAHNDDISHNENVALQFYTKQVSDRKDSLDAKIAQINDYKKTNSLVDVSHQRETVITLLKDLEMKREEMSQQIPALQNQLRILNNQIQRYNKVNMEALVQSMELGEGFSSINAEIESLNNQYVENLAAGKSTAAIEQRIEKLRKDQAALIARNVPVSSKTIDKIDDQVRQWMQDWLQKQLDLELAKAAKNSYDQEIQKQNAKAGKLLTDDNQLARLTAEKERLEKEYLRATEEYDKARLYAEGTENPLAIVEPVALPDEPESKHRAVFSAFAAVAGGSLASIVLLLLAFFDTSVQLPAQFQRITRLPLLGSVNKIVAGKINLYPLFHQRQHDSELEIFKENIRKLRTAIETSGAQSFLFVSPKEQEGKSFLIILLAYALGLNQKKILLIDTNFKNNTLSDFKTRTFFEVETEELPALRRMALFKAGGQQTSMQFPPGEPADLNLKNIDIVGNKGGSQSPSEVLAGKDFRQVIQNYGRKYDFIFLEAASMNKYSDARELVPFVEKVVAVISSESSTGHADKDSLEFLRSLEDKMLGGILNKVDLKNL